MYISSNVRQDLTSGQLAKKLIDFPCSLHPRQMLGQARCRLLQNEGGRLSVGNFETTSLSQELHL